MPSSPSNQVRPEGEALGLARTEYEPAPGLILRLPVDDGDLDPEWKHRAKPNPSASSLDRLPLNVLQREAHFNPSSFRQISHSLPLPFEQLRCELETSLAARGAPAVPWSESVAQAPSPY